MGKHKEKRKTDAAASSSGASASGNGSKERPSSSIPFGTRGLLIGLVGVGIAVLVQLALTSKSPPPPPPPKSGLRPNAAKSKSEPAKPPAICPDDWAQCPKVPGIDWVALEAAAIPQPSEEALAACHAPEPLLSPHKVKGMHLVCMLPPPPEHAASAAATLAVFKHMERGMAPELMLVPMLKKADHAVAALTRGLKLPRKPSKLYQKPALFSEDGVRLAKATLLTYSGGTDGASGGTDGASGGDSGRSGGSGGGARRLLLLEGGQWLWPPVDIGHVKVLRDLKGPGTSTRVVTLSMRPLVVQVEVEDFLTDDEAQHIIGRAKPHMAKSGVALKDADKGKAAKEFRTSSQYFLPTTRDPLLERVDERVMRLTRIPITHAEYIQVLMYNQFEHYSAHHDFFDPAAYATNPQMLASVEHGAKNRLATVFFYLNNVTDDADLTKGGGQTNFPRAATKQFPNGGPQPRDFFDCSKGLSVFPQGGKVIIFYSMLPDGSMDDLSLHGGCDVLDASATKWSANFWLWNKPYHFVDPARHRAAQELIAGWL